MIGTGFRNSHTIHSLWTCIRSGQIELKEVKAKTRHAMQSATSGVCVCFSFYAERRAMLGGRGAHPLPLLAPIGNGKSKDCHLINESSPLDECSMKVCAESEPLSLLCALQTRKPGRQCHHSPWHDRRRRRHHHHHNHHHRG